MFWFSRRSAVLSELSSRGFALKRIKSGRPGGRYAACELSHQLYSFDSFNKNDPSRIRFIFTNSHQWWCRLGTSAMEKTLTDLKCDSSVSSLLHISKHLAVMPHPDYVSDLPFNLLWTCKTKNFWKKPRRTHYLLMIYVLKFIFQAERQKREDADAHRKAEDEAKKKIALSNMGSGYSGILQRVVSFFTYFIYCSLK